MALSFLQWGSFLRWLRAPERQVWLFALLVCIALFGITTWRLVRAHDLALADSEITTANLARSLADHANAVVQEADIVVAGVVERLQVDGQSEAALARLHRVLATRVATVPVLKSLLVADAAGSILTSSFDRTPAINVADRAYFQYHLDHPGTAPLLGPPIRNRVGGEWSITVTRRFDRPDGSFAGVVVALIDCDSFGRFYSTFDVGSHGSITLINESNTIVVRQPQPADPDYRDRAAILGFWQRGSAGTGRLISPLDGVARVYGYRKADPTPLLVVVALSEDEVLAVWRHDMRFALAVSAAISAGLGLLGWWLARQIRQGERREAAVRRSEAQYRLLADYSTDVIIQLDAQCRRDYVSPACERLLGFHPEEMLGGHPRDSIHPDDWPTVEAFIAAIRQGGQATPVNYRMRHKDGSYVWVETDGRRLDASDGFIVTIRDATLRREAEERLHSSNDRLSAANAALERLARHLAKARDGAELASRAKSRFLAGISHELRTPLNGILGYAQLLHLEGGLNPVQSGRVGAMLAAGEHLLEMINRVLDLSEVEAGHTELRLSEVDPAAVAQACLDLVRLAAEAKGLMLHFVAAGTVPRRFTTDPTALRQVLLNLLGNAVKFTRRGGVQLRLQTAPDGMGLRFEIADTGPGIPAEQRHRLFHDFERLGAEESDMVEGAGLGLALSARLAGLLGGTIGHADNPDGAGSLFWIDLPQAAAPAEAPPAPEPAQAEPVPAAVQSRRVLVVDDVAMNRDVAASFLRSAGHDVDCAEDGAAAVAAAEAGDFDVILMDVRMPVMDGLEATRRIRALAGPRGRVPVVALTAQAFTDQIQQCLHAGMDSHLAKPFTPAALLDAVARAADAGREREADLPAEPAPEAAGLPLLDMEAFRRTADFLPQDAVASYLQAIARRGEAFLADLRRHESGEASEGLAAAAHTLAGSAGMFGLARMADAARRFEHALEAGLPEATTIARELDAAIGNSLKELQSVYQVVP